MLKMKLTLLSVFSLLLMSCTATIINSTKPEPISVHDKIAVISFSNNTETPLAGQRAMSITAATLKSRGFTHVETFYHQDQSNILLPGTYKVKSREEQMQWARQIGARYVMTGNVNEWTYKVGLDGEPVAGISLQLIELPSKRTVWTAVGSKSGGSRVALTTVAQDLINALLIRLCPAVKHNG